MGTAAATTPGRAGLDGSGRGGSSSVLLCVICQGGGEIPVPPERTDLRHLSPSSASCVFVCMSTLNPFPPNPFQLLCGLTLLSSFSPPPFNFIDLQGSPPAQLVRHRNAEYWTPTLGGGSGRKGWATKGPFFLSPRPPTSCHPPSCVWCVCVCLPHMCMCV